MTGYTVHTGSSVKFSNGWDQIFAKGSKKTSAQAKAGAKTATAKKKPSSKKRGGR